MDKISTTILFNLFFESRYETNVVGFGSVDYWSSRDLVFVCHSGAVRGFLVPSKVGNSLGSLVVNIELNGVFFVFSSMGIPVFCTVFDK